MKNIKTGIAIAVALIVALGALWLQGNPLATVGQSADSSDAEDVLSENIADSLGQLAE